MKIEFIGWSQEGNSDKVWGIAEFGRGEFRNSTKYACFWGRRGKKLQKKLVDLTGIEKHKLISSKLKKGYREVEADRIDEVYDRFGKDIFVVALSIT